MKKYEALVLEISECTDVVSTSADVTTEDIVIPWNISNGSEVSEESYEI